MDNQPITFHTYLIDAVMNHELDHHVRLFLFGIARYNSEVFAILIRRVLVRKKA